MVINLMDEIEVFATYNGITKKYLVMAVTVQDLLNDPRYKDNKSLLLLARPDIVHPPKPRKKRKQKSTRQLIADLQEESKSTRQLIADLQEESKLTRQLIADLQEESKLTRQLIYEMQKDIKEIKQWQNNADAMFKQHGWIK